MILYEFEGKILLSNSNIAVPNSQLVKSTSDKIKLKTPFFAKSQVLSGKRKDVGGIIEVKNENEVKSTLSKMLGGVVNKEKVALLLLEEKVEFKEEFYISVSYDTDLRTLVVTYSEKGGPGIEQRKSHSFAVNILTLEVDYPKNIKIDPKLKDFIAKLIDLFLKEDATLVEINPVVITKEGNVMALDAKIKLDENAFSRHSERIFPPRSVPGYSPTKNEIEAKKIDEGDHRGTAGSAYFDLPGDIAVLASGGGASLTAMDALLEAGGKPSNYTEYSGNPPKEKVEKLASIVLGKPGINGLWVVGAIANFTNIFQTLSGFLEALKKIKPRPNYPIIIRRGGPQDKEAFEMLKKETDYDFHLYGQEISITRSAEIMADLAKKYATSTK
ncbi:MAG: ATP citrate lyase citrate-binding domain-containing protein [Microgenomates group bacterium]